MEKRQIKLSANFKRDYVAASAVVLFFLIVISEVVLAISIPAYLSRETAMAFEVRRIKLLGSFDDARRIISRKMPSDPTAAAEMKLLGWELDNMAMYLRVNRTLINSDEVAALQKELDEIHTLLGQLQQNRPFSQEYRLDTAVYLDPLVPEVPAEFAAKPENAASPKAGKAKAPKTVKKSVRPASKPAAKPAATNASKPAAKGVPSRKKGK